MEQLEWKNGGWRRSTGGEMMFGFYIWLLNCYFLVESVKLLRRGRIVCFSYQAEVGIF